MQNRRWHGFRFRNDVLHVDLKTYQTANSTITPLRTPYHVGEVGWGFRQIVLNSYGNSSSAYLVGRRSVAILAQAWEGRIPRLLFGDPG